MNLKPTYLILPGLAAALVLPARAIEAPEDDAPPPAAAEAGAAAGAAGEAGPANDKPAAPAEAAYLGVVTGKVPEMLANHLGLKQGEGIVILSVMPDGPAGRAGLAVHDVITRVEGKEVNSAADLTREIGARRPGDEVKLAVIRKGKPDEVKVALGKRPADLAGPALEPLDGLQLDGLPNELADRVRRMIEGNLGAMEWPMDPAEPLNPPPQIEDAMRQMKERMEKAFGGFNIEVPGVQGRVEVQQGATLRMMDDQGSVEVQAHDGSKEVTVRDKENQVVWNGPWDTDQDKAAAPDDVRQRIERLNLDTRMNGNGIHLRMGQAPPAPLPEDEE